MNYVSIRAFYGLRIVWHSLGYESTHASVLISWHIIGKLVAQKLLLRLKNSSWAMSPVFLNTLFQEGLKNRDR